MNYSFKLEKCKQFVIVAIFIMYRYTAIISTIIHVSFYLPFLDSEELLLRIPALQLTIIQIFIFLYDLHFSNDTLDA